MATIKSLSLIIVPFALALSLLGVPSHAATKASDEPARTPSMQESLAQVARIANELKRIDGRLQHVEKSMDGIDKSLGPVGIALKEEAIRAILKEAGDVALDRAKSLILLGTACLAALILLHVFLRRWQKR